MGTANVRDRHPHPAVRSSARIPAPIGSGTEWGNDIEGVEIRLDLAYT